MKTLCLFSAAACIALVGAAACNGEGPPGPVDGGADEPDAGVADASGQPMDAGHDDGSDAGVTEDAGGQDAAAFDAGADAGDPRQALRDRTIFANAGFDLSGPVGLEPSSWTCTYTGTGEPPTPLCRIWDSVHAAQGTSFLEIGRGVEVSQEAVSYDRGGSLSFSIYSIGVELSQCVIIGYTGAQALWTLSAKTQQPAGGAPGVDHCQVLESGAQPLAGTYRVRLVITNNGSAAHVYVDDLIAVVDP